MTSRTDRVASLRAPVAWRDRRLWLVQGVVLLVAAVRWVVEVAVTRAHAPVPGLPDFTTLGLFLWPVLYAAVTVGAAGAAVTTAFVAALSVPRDLLFLRGGDPVAVWAESTQVAALCLVAVVVGQRVAAERAASARAEAARAAHLASEVRYRSLFDASESPTVLVTGRGLVLEANRAARQLAGRLPRTLAELVGAEVAATLLTPSPGATAGAGASVATHRPGSRTATVTVGEGAGRRRFRVTAVAVAAAGAAPPATVEATVGDDGVVQVVLTDVTAEERERQQAETFAAGVVAAQEEERRRLAQELHDGPLQTLVHLARQLEVDGEPPATTPAAREVALEVVDELRRITRGLRPSVLDDLGLIEALRRVTDDVAEQFHVAVALEVTGPARRLPAVLELTVFRVAQEAMANAARHSRASTVRVVVAFGLRWLRLLVADDGCGFDDPDRASRQAAGSLGLSGMAERLRLVGGHLAVHSDPGTGTTVEAAVPCPPPDGQPTRTTGGSPRGLAEPQPPDLERGPPDPG